MNLDSELDGWQRRWREQPAPTMSVEELVGTVHRGTRNTRWWTVAAAVLTLLALVPLVRKGLTGATDPRLVAGTVIFAALVWASVLWLSRGTWRPRDESTAAFLEVSIRRCRAALWGVPVGIFLYCAQLAYVLVAVQRAQQIDWWTLLGSPHVIAVGWVCGPLYVAGQLWYGRVQRARLAKLRALQAELDPRG